MNDFLVYLGIGIMLIAILFAYQYYNVRFTKQLSIILYKDKKVKDFLEQLESIKGKLFVRKKQREILKLDAYAIANDRQALLKQFEYLETLKLSYGKKISLYEKEVLYYANNKENEKAETAYNKLIELGSQIENDRMDKILAEARITMEVYVYRNGSFASKLVDLAKVSDNKMAKGLNYYRASRCYYYLNDKENVLKYLKKAENNLTSKEWRHHIDLCKNDFSQLEKM